MPKEERSFCESHNRTKEWQDNYHLFGSAKDAAELINVKSYR